MREADLTRMTLATGLNALAKANHKQSGLYNQAFFNIAIGFERLMKLIILIEYGLTHDGAFFSEEDLRTRSAMMFVFYSMSPSGCVPPSGGD